MAKHYTRKPRVHKDAKGLYYKVKGRKVRLRMKTGKTKGKSKHSSYHKNNHISIGSIQRAIFHAAPAVKRRRRKKPVTKEQISATASSIADNLPEAVGFSNQLGTQLGIHQSYALSNANREQIRALEHKVTETKGESVTMSQKLQNLLDAPAALNRDDAVGLYYDIKNEIDKKFGDLKRQTGQPTRPMPPTSGNSPFVSSPIRGISGLLSNPLGMFTSGYQTVDTSQWGALGDDDDTSGNSPFVGDPPSAPSASDVKDAKKRESKAADEPYIDPELYETGEEQPDALRALISNEMTYGAVMAKLRPMGKGPISARAKILGLRNARSKSKEEVANAIVAQKRFDLLEKQPGEAKTGKGDAANGEGTTDKFIIKHMKPYRSLGFQGVIMSDEIHTLKPLPETSFIMNLGPSTTQGHHWVACYISCLDDCTIEYYDSLSGKMPKRFLRDVKKYIIDPLPSKECPCMLKVKENKVRDQSVSSDTCGFFAMKFLIDRYAGKSFKAASGYSSVGEAEKEVKAFKKHV